MARARLFVALALSLVWATGYAQSTDGDHAVVLMYHHVDTATPASTSVTPAAFRAHMEYLESEGFNVWPLERIFDHLADAEPLPEKTVALTFDDGYASVLTQAAPLLRARNWPFTVFVSTAAIDAGYRSFLSWDDLRELSDQGATIANHTRTHAHLVQRAAGESHAQWEQRVRADISDAQGRIEQEIGRAPRLFAYPYGEFDADLERIVAALGLYALGQHSGAVAAYSDLHAAPRFPLATGYDDMETFASRLRARALPIIEPRVHAAVRGSDDRPAIRIDVGPGPFRLDELACYASGQGAMELTRRGERSFEARPRQAISPGRTKYNCTAPSSTENGVYYWSSFLWMTRNADGSWYTD